MTSAQFRSLALGFPEAVEAAHMGHPDFRVRGKIFASLSMRKNVEWGMVKLTLEQQTQLVAKHPTMFEPVPGGWGRRGATYVRLAKATRPVMRGALFIAWLNSAPQQLIRELDNAAE